MADRGCCDTDLVVFGHVQPCPQAQPNHRWSTENDRAVAEVSQQIRWSHDEQTAARRTERRRTHPGWWRRMNPERITQ